MSKYVEYAEHITFSVKILYLAFKISSFISFIISMKLLDVFPLTKFQLPLDFVYVLN